MEKHLAMRKRWKKKLQYCRNNFQLYLLLAFVMLYFIVFKYFPIYGLRMAFMNYNPVFGFERSTWVGLQQFQKLFESLYFWPVFCNTLGLSIYSILAGWPFPILFALLVNTLRREHLKKTIQTVVYAPHFISTVVIVGMLKLFLSPTSGIVNQIIVLAGGQAVNFFSRSNAFPHIYVWSGIWQDMGWNSVIYIAALSGIDMELHEAATIDGASRLKRIWHIDLPGIMPTIVILSIMSFANIIGIGFEKIYLMQNDQNIGASEVIATYSYKVGLQQMQYSYSAAVSMFNSLVTFLMLMLMNFISKRVTEISLW